MGESYPKNAVPLRSAMPSMSLESRRMYSVDGREIILLETVQSDICQGTGTGRSGGMRDLCCCDSRSDERQ